MSISKQSQVKRRALRSKAIIQKVFILFPISDVIFGNHTSHAYHLSLRTIISLSSQLDPNPFSFLILI